MKAVCDDIERPIPEVIITIIINNYYKIMKAVCYDMEQPLIPEVI